MEDENNSSIPQTPEHDQHSPSPDPPHDPVEENPESKPSFDESGILRAMEVVERDSLAIAESYASLFSSLRFALSEVTSSSVDHMHCFSDATGRLQESALDAASRGNRFINSCLRLNQEMKGIETLAMHLKVLRQNVDALDSAVNKLVRLPNPALSQHNGASKG
ncbi:hypothetical protein Scep_006258 [Stephania cephalantha]|uniref:BLOC-1-related complex subunit 6 C-terminal helix domain-containing protein n=1 Tax=Stephania cephalantha TaxID=152367 RepID=A0AAP0K7Q0_9MAGN